MKISLIIPTYNRSSFLIDTINSVLNQTVKIDEIIIVDDGSTDDTEQLIKQYPNIKYIKQKNKGVSSTRNNGINNASNQWICFLDSDDIWEQNKLEKQIEFHKNNPNIYISHTDEHWIFNGKTINQKKHQLKPSGFCFKKNIPLTLIGASTVMIHKSIIDDIGLFDESLIACEDYDLWLRILSKYELGLINEKLIRKIAGHKEQLSFTTPMMDGYRITALQKHLNSEYKDIIKQEIIKKSTILIKGAIKHNNQEIQTKYEKILNETT